MKLVIEIHDIPQNDHERWALKNGTPLPKGHGDLIDRSTLEPDTEWSEWYDGWISYSYGQIADADVVIKADGGEDDADSN